jgi:hypothetical protein
VVNINVWTKFHRDPGDFLKICCVLVIGEFKGGELGLVEPGLVVELRNGDAIIFSSGRLSHLNLEYKGKQGSIVMHTDCSLEVWRDHKNHWDGSDFMT